MENIFNIRGLLGMNHSKSEHIISKRNRRRSTGAIHINERALTDAKHNIEHTVKSIETSNTEIQDFLFTLGCYEGENITIISILGDQYVVVIKDARYSIDKDLADSIIV